METGTGHAILLLDIELLTTTSFWERERQFTKRVAPVNQPQPAVEDHIAKNI